MQCEKRCECSETVWPCQEDGQKQAGEKNVCNGRSGGEGESKKWVKYITMKKGG